MSTPTQSMLIMKSQGIQNFLIDKHTLNKRTTVIGGQQFFTAHHAHQWQSTESKKPNGT